MAPLQPGLLNKILSVSKLPAQTAHQQLATGLSPCGEFLAPFTKCQMKPGCNPQQQTHLIGSGRCCVLQFRDSSVLSHEALRPAHSCNATAYAANGTRIQGHQAWTATSNIHEQLLWIAAIPTQMGMTHK